MDLSNSIPTHMDHDGHTKAEKRYRVIIILFATVCLMWGYLIQLFSQTVYILGAGFILAAMLIVPSWPMYRRKLLNWQKARIEPVPSSNVFKKPKKK